MFSAVFWVLAFWLIVNLVWTVAQLGNRLMSKTFAWINVVVVIIGFWTYYAANNGSGIAPWFLFINWTNVVLAIFQFYNGYRPHQYTKRPKK